MHAWCSSEYLSIYIIMNWNTFSNVLANHFDVFFLNKKTTYNNKPDTFNLLLQRFLRLQPSLSDKIKTKINLLEWETRPKRENLNKCPPVVVCVSTAVTKVDM